MQLQSTTEFPERHLSKDKITYRQFKGEIDYSTILAIIEGSKKSDDIERTDSLDDIKNNYEHLTNSDPYEDMVFVEDGPSTVGYTRVWWYDVVNGPLLYSHFAFLLSQYRGIGIRQEMVKRNEQRLRAIASQHDPERDKFFEAWTTDSEKDWINVLEQQGY